LSYSRTRAKFSHLIASLSVFISFFIVLKSNLRTSILNFVSISWSRVKDKLATDKISFDFDFSSNLLLLYGPNSFTSFEMTSFFGQKVCRYDCCQSNLHNYKKFTNKFSAKHNTSILKLLTTL